MYAWNYWGSIIAVIYLYVNTVSIIKKIKNDEDTSSNTLVGSILSGFILLSIMTISMR